MANLKSKLSIISNLEIDKLSNIIREYISTQCMIHNIIFVNAEDLTQKQIDKILPEHSKRTERLSELIAVAVAESLEIDFEKLKDLIDDKLGDNYKAAYLAEIIRLSLFKLLNFRTKI